MPVMDGVTTTRAIRDGQAGDDKKSVPIIALTAYAMVGDMERFLASGMDGYVPKPVEMEALNQAFAEVVGDGRNEA